MTSRVSIRAQAALPQGPLTISPLPGLRVSLAAALLALAGGAVAVPPEPARQPTRDEGLIEPSGKFTPHAADHGAGRPLRTREEVEAALRESLRIQPLDDHRLRVGQVIIDRKVRAVRFQVTVNMVEGPVEYLVVTEQGKVHEAVFSTKADPKDVHLAMLLLGVKPAEMRLGADGDLEMPAAAAITATVEWETNGPPAVHPLSAMIALADGAPGQTTGRTLGESPWLYNGSVVDAAGFRAAAEGSIVSLIADGAALLNNPGKTRDDDKFNVPNKALLPRKGMPATVVLTCPAAAAPPRQTTPEQPGREQSPPSGQKPAPHP
ncbi:MAG: YdjY domain-containing protein [Akkermansiaceae bacterium]|nr:YdjY domain-containing protein [Akkermansiaceae bacterium]